MGDQCGRRPGRLRPQGCLCLRPQVVATDSASQNSSTATVTIHIRDINDHRPSFPQSSYVLCLPEHSAAGFVVTSDILVSDSARSRGGLGGRPAAWGPSHVGVCCWHWEPSSRRDGECVGWVWPCMRLSEQGSQ